MLKIIDLTASKNNESEILSIISNVINSNSTTIEIYDTQFPYFEKLGFTAVETDDDELKILKENYIISEYPFKSERSFQKIEGNKKTVITFTQNDFAPWQSNNVRYLLASKVFYKNDKIGNGTKPAIVFHSKASLTKDFLNLQVFYENDEINIIYKSNEEFYRKNLQSNKKYFVKFVEYETPVKIKDVEISINKKIFNFESISAILKRIENIKVSKLVHFEKILTKDELLLLEIISI